MLNFNPKWIQLQLTESCNLKCTICYERNSVAYKKKQFVLDFTRTKEIIDECSSFHPHYELFGGEPLMYPHLKELLEYINKKNSKVTIPTNGTLLAKKAQTLLGNSVEKVWVSLDGPQEINNRQRGINSYQAAERGILALYEHRLKAQLEYPRIGVHCVVTADNYTYLEEMVNNPELFQYVDDFSFELQKYLTPDKYKEYIDLLNEEKPVIEANYAKGYIQDVKMFAFINAEALHSSLTNIKATCQKNDKGFYTNPDKLDSFDIKNYFSANWDNMKTHHKSCIFPFTYSEISAKGDVTLCHSFYDDVLGNIYQQGLLDIWNNQRANSLRKSIRKKLLPICYACCSFFNSENKA